MRVPRNQKDKLPRQWRLALGTTRDLMWSYLMAGFGRQFCYATEGSVQVSPESWEEYGKTEGMWSIKKSFRKESLGKWEGKEQQCCSWGIPPLPRVSQSLLLDSNRQTVLLQKKYTVLPWPLCLHMQLPPLCIAIAAHTLTHAHRAIRRNRYCCLCPVQPIS